jgi:hypothetical protein
LPDEPGCGRHGRALLLVASVLLVAAIPARGDEPPIVADRPGFGESASVVVRYRLQVETGASATWVGSDSTVLDAPQTLLRLGLPGSLEVRVGVPDRVDAHGSAEDTAGWTDLTVGVKGHVGVRGNDVSLRATAYLPTGSIALTSDRLDPELAVAWSRSLSGPWSLGATVSQRWLRRLDESFTSPSVSFGRSLGESASTFVEYGAVLSPDSAPVNRFDHGYAWNPGPRTQVDVSLGIVLSRAPTTFFVGAGFCHRF